MIPNVFISSTVEDLHHLRDAIRQVVIGLDYNPVMSDYGEVGYISNLSAEESCYHCIRDCQLAVLIVGKRYGHVSTNGNSITHNEFLSAREQRIPAFCLVDQEVLSFKKVYDANLTKKSTKLFPGMDHPDKTFRLIQEIIEAPTGNAILAFSNVSEAQSTLKKQIALLFGELLKGRFAPIREEIKDILSEIKTLRHEMVSKEASKEASRFLKATRFLVDDRHKDYRNFVEFISGNLEAAVPLLLESRSFDEFLSKAGSSVEIVPHFKLPDFNSLSQEGYTSLTSLLTRDPETGKYIPPPATWGAKKGGIIFMNERAKKLFDGRHDDLKATIPADLEQGNRP